jgi:hypothetical protein
MKNIFSLISLCLFSVAAFAEQDPFTGPSEAQVQCVVKLSNASSDLGAAMGQVKHDYISSLSGDAKDPFEGFKTPEGQQAKGYAEGVDATLRSILQNYCYKFVR